MKPKAQNRRKIKRETNFRDSQIIDISSLNEKQTSFRVFLSPYNSYLLIVFDQMNPLKLYEYKNRSLINYQQSENINDLIQNKYFFKCLFMKNTNEFILEYDREIQFCRIEQNQKWKTIQVIQKKRTRGEIALSSDDQTFFLSDIHINVYKKFQQQTRNANWVCVQWLKISLESTYEINFNDSCNTLILNGYWDCWIVINYKNLKIKRLLKYQKKNLSTKILGLFKDQFIILKDLIIQWNRQSRKILRQYEPKMGNNKITLRSYNHDNIFNLASFNQQLIVWEFQNGEIIPLQILENQYLCDGALIGNYDQLLIMYSLYGTNEIIFYEQTW